MNLMVQFKAFHSRATVNKYPPSVRVLYDALLFDFNGKYWPEHCIYSQRGLSELTGLSKTAARDALIFLSQHGLLKVRSANRQTVIRVIELDEGDQLLTDNRPITDRLLTDSRPIADRPSGLSIARTREDTDKDLRHDKTVDVARARTDTVDADGELVKTWRDNNGAPVTAELLSYLAVLVNKYGAARTDEIIRSASDNYGGQFSMTPAFLKKHVEILEGGRKRGKVVQLPSEYKKPDTRFDSEFGL